MMTKHCNAGPLRNARHERMAQALAEGANQEAAYVEAGYSQKGARQSASALLRRHPEILSRRNDLIEEREDARSSAVAKAADKFEITETDTLAEVSAISFSDPRLLFDDNGNIKDQNDWPDHLAAAVASFEVFEKYQGQGKDRTYVGRVKRIKFWDKNAALEKLMRHLGMFGRDNQQRDQSPLAKLPPRVQYEIYSQILKLAGGEQGAEG